MNKLKRLKNGKIRLNGIVYKPYTICNIPANFGCITFQGDKEGINEWIKIDQSPYQGLTYIAEK
jgi:hypothetical protein